VANFFERKQFPEIADCEITSQTGHSIGEADLECDDACRQRGSHAIDGHDHPGAFQKAYPTQTISSVTTRCIVNDRSEVDPRGHAYGLVEYRTATAAQVPIHGTRFRIIHAAAYGRYRRAQCFTVATKHPGTTGQPHSLGCAKRGAGELRLSSQSGLGLSHIEIGVNGGSRPQHNPPCKMRNISG
jgi:hypothetical protein